MFLFLIVWGSDAQEKEPNDTKDFYLKKGKGFEFHFDEDKYMF